MRLRGNCSYEIQPKTTTPMTTIRIATGRVVVNLKNWPVCSFSAFSFDLSESCIVTWLDFVNKISSCSCLPLEYFLARQRH